MPSALLSFGSNDDIDRDRAGATAHFYGNTDNGGVDYSAEVAANSSLTDTGALSTDDTATYASMDQAGFRADMDASHGNPLASERFLGVKARQDVAYSLPVGAVDVVATLIVVARTNWGHVRWLGSIAGYDEAGNYTHSTTLTLYDASSAWTRHQAAIAAPAALLTALAMRQATMSVTPNSWTNNVTPLGIDDVAFLGLELSWTTPTPTATHAPPLRQWPRSDGLGLSSARRIWPPPRSRQRSLRQGPGSYL